MKNKLKIYENPISYVILIMLCIGTVMLYSASSTLGINKFDHYAFYLNKHLTRLAISIFAFTFIYNINFKWLKKYSYELLVLSWIIMISAYFFNDNTATKRWLIIFGKNIFTTSDFARICLIIFTASYIEDNRKKLNNIKLLITNYVPYFIITILLIFFQPDLSTSFAISLIIVTLLVISGLKLKHLLLPSFFVSIGVAIKIMSTNFQYKRFTNWFYGDYNSQVENAIQALGNGGFWGVGIGKSIIKDGFMPEVHTDFILPIIGEEIGYIGILILFILYHWLFFYGMKISKNAPDVFSSMLSIGITVNILYYFLINASYVVGVLPTTGLPIPFISYGGSQMLFSLFSIGLLMNISKHSNIYKYKTL